MFDVGRLCVKIAGRDAGKKCVVVEILDRTYVLVDGETRRRKCNIAHLEPLDKVLDIQKGASHEAVSAALKHEGMSARQTKSKPSTKKPEVQRKKATLEQKEPQEGATAPSKKKTESE
jgi:large subunit ribosomal protein L14e